MPSGVMGQSMAQADVSELEVREGILELGALRGGPGPTRQFEPSQALQGLSEEDVRPGQVRVEPNGLAKTRLRLLEPPLTEQYLAEALVAL